MSVFFTSDMHWEQELNGNIIHIRGNHDDNNGVKCALNYAVIEFGKMKWLLIHKPPEDEAGRQLVNSLKVDAVLCGHIHQHWSYKELPMTRGNLTMINVGVDVRNWYPMTKNEIMSVHTRNIRKTAVRAGVPNN